MTAIDEGSKKEERNFLKSIKKNSQENDMLIILHKNQ